MIGTVDMDAVFKGYEKFKATNKEFQAAVLARQNELMKIKSEGEEEAQMLAKLTPGTEDFKKHEDRSDRAEGPPRRRPRASPARVSAPRV